MPDRHGNEVRRTPFIRHVDGLRHLATLSPLDQYEAESAERLDFRQLWHNVLPEHSDDGHLEASCPRPRRMELQATDGLLENQNVSKMV